MFRSNVSYEFLYFVGKVSDENSWNVSTRVNISMYILYYIYIHIVVSTKEFSENKVLNIVNVEL